MAEDVINDLKRSLFQIIIQVDRTCNHIYSFKKKAEVLTQTHRGEATRREEQYDHGGRDWTDAATSKEHQARVTKSWKRQGMDSPLECSEENSPTNNLISDFQSPKL